MRGKMYTELDKALIKDMFYRGASVADIAKRTGRTISSIRTRLGLMGLNPSDRDAKHQKPENVVNPVNEETTKTSVEPVKQKTLNDFSPREIIRHMYKLGFRIRGDLYQIVERKVLLNDIIAQ